MQWEIYELAMEVFEEVNSPLDIASEWAPISS